MDNKEFLMVDHVEKSFNGKKVLKEFSLYMKPGEIVGLLGSNGSGKTTLLKLITHLLIPEKGDIFFCGYDIKKDYDKALKKMGVVLADRILHNGLTGFWNLYLKGRLCQKSDRESIERASGIFHVQEYLNRKCKEYSLGMRQRLCLTMACLSEPELLILDEPMNGLDPEGLQQLSYELRQMARENNVAILISSHLLYDVENLCDRVLFIKNGELLGEEEIDAIHKDGKKLVDVYFEKMGEINRNDWAVNSK